MAFYDNIFFRNRPSFEPLSLSFQEVSNIAIIPIQDVEKFIVHLLSIEIFLGRVEGVEQKFFITRVRPQDMDNNRLLKLKQNFDQWGDGVKEAIDFINSC